MSAAGDAHWIGQTIGERYVVRRFIGKGGMGAVYEGEQPALERRVAIKFLRDDAMTPSMRERFRREARLASKVIHEHVAQVFDILTTPDGHELIVMELVEGKDLGTVLEVDGPLSVERTLVIARGMLEGLAAIHDAGIVHRDVKPSNVLLARRGGGDEVIVKIADFGLARGAGDASLTKTGHVVGTTPFMAPELFRGEELDHRGDLYAVGITLYQMLAGKLPFQGATAEIGAQHVYHAPPPLAEQRAGIPPHVVRAIERALAKSPADRFPDARSFLAALEGAGPAMLEPVTQSPATLHATPRSKARAATSPGAMPRPRRWPWVAALGVIALGGGVGAYLARSRGPARDVPDPRPVEVVAEVASDAGMPPSVLAPVDASTIAVATAPVDAAPPVAVDAVSHTGSGARHKAAADPRTSEGPRGRCQCIPTSGEAIALCPSAGTPLCRCNDSRGYPLCPEPLIPCRYDERETIEKAGFEYAQICLEEQTHRCPDLGWQTFKRPGVAGAACTGWTAHDKKRQWLWPRENERLAGHLDCDACPGANTRTYRGAAGDPCTGYHWRTGTEVRGSLQHCE